jgi:hypothetical protein
MLLQKYECFVHPIEANSIKAAINQLYGKPSGPNFSVQLMDITKSPQVEAVLQPDRTCTNQLSK